MSNLLPSGPGQNPQPFRFFDLPSELRHLILSLVLSVDTVIDIDFNSYQKTLMFAVSRRFHIEAAAVFYGVNAFRLFPTRGRVEGNKAKPLIMRLPSHYRAYLVSLELRLGPFWSQPPKCWNVSDALGLGEAAAVRVLKVFIEVDPSHPVFHGFRKDKDFYTFFAGSLLREVIARLPKLEEVQIDGYPSVTRDSQLVKRLIQEAERGSKRISWALGRTANCDCHHLTQEFHSLRPCGEHNMSNA